MKTLLGHIRSKHCLRGPVRLGHIINALFTLQSTTAAVTRGACLSWYFPERRTGPFGPAGGGPPMVPLGAALLRLSAGEALLRRWWR